MYAHILKGNNITYASIQTFTMKKTKKSVLFLFILTLYTVNVFACSCYCKKKCNFKWESKSSHFVALIKVVAYLDFTEWDSNGTHHKMPLSMRVEIVKNYKGFKNKKSIVIWGDNGALCRPYLSEFKVGQYYLIAPSQIDENTESGKKGDFDFFACAVDYLQVNYKKGMAYGKYSIFRRRIDLKTFERKMLNN